MSLVGDSRTDSICRATIHAEAFLGMSMVATGEVENDNQQKHIIFYHM